MAAIRNRGGSESLGSARSDKRDRYAAALCLLFFAPLIALVYLFLRIENDAVFIVQRRPRGDGSIFMAWRFRIVGRCDELARGAVNPAHRGLRTLVGAFLYESRLEVLPALYNVFRGEISLQEMLYET